MFMRVTIMRRTARINNIYHLHMKLVEIWCMPHAHTKCTRNERAANASAQVDWSPVIPFGVRPARVYLYRVKVYTRMCNIDTQRTSRAPTKNHTMLAI